MRWKLMTFAGIKMVINEQFAIHGNVDFPPTDQNMVPVISALSPLGYMPNTVQEINPGDGVGMFRMALHNMKDTQIIFGSNKIQITRSASPHSQVDTDFIEFALSVFERINQFRQMSLTRIGLTKEIFLPEISSVEMDGVYKKLVNDAEGALPFEWSLRTASRCSIEGGDDLIVTEVGRSQGTINDNGRITEFDRLRLKIEAGTDNNNAIPKFNYENLRDISRVLSGKITEQGRALERRLYG